MATRHWLQQQKIDHEETKYNIKYSKTKWKKSTSNIVIYILYVLDRASF